MGRPRMEHRRASITMAVDERDVAALRDWASERYGTIDRYAEIVREAIADALRRAGRLGRAHDSDRQRTIWFARAPLVGWDGVRPVTDVSNTPAPIDSSTPATSPASVKPRKGCCSQCRAEIPKATKGTTIAGVTYAPETCGHLTCVEMNGGVL